MSSIINGLRELPPHVNREPLIKVLEGQRIDLSNAKYKITKIFEGRWFSSMYHLELQSTTKKLCVYIKCLPEDVKKRESIKSSLNFQNEVTFYNMILPEFRQLQSQMCPQELRPPVFVPICYAAEVNGNSDILILSDMCTGGFVLLDRLKPMKIPEICLVMSELGRFHAFSLVLKLEKPEKITEIRKKLVEPNFENPQFENMFQHLLKNFLNDLYIKLCGHYDKESIYVKKYEKFMLVAPAILPIQAHTDPKNEAYNVIAHGDLWVNNYLFRYSEDGTEPDDICFLDFQQIRYNSPALDLGRVMFVAMDKATRYKHREYLLCCYHNSLSRTVRALGFNPDEILPFDELEQQLKKYSALYTFMSMFNIVNSLFDEHEGDELFTGDINEARNANRAAQQGMNDKCRQRVFEIVEECVDRGYMDFDEWNNLL